MDILIDRNGRRAFPSQLIPFLSRSLAVYVCDSTPLSLWVTTKGICTISLKVFTCGVNDFDFFFNSHFFLLRIERLVTSSKLTLARLVRGESVSCMYLLTLCLLKY